MQYKRPRNFFKCPTPSPGSKLSERNTPVLGSDTSGRRLAKEPARVRFHLVIYLITRRVVLTSQLLFARVCRRRRRRSIDEQRLGGDFVADYHCAGVTSVAYAVRVLSL